LESLIFTEDLFIVQAIEAKDVALYLISIYNSERQWLEKCQLLNE